MQPKFYLIGGANRDFYLGISKVKDLDYVVVCNSFEEMRQAILDRKGEIFLETKKFLTIRAKIPELGASDFVLARKDGTYFDGRRPDSVEIGSLLEDQKRRDFTCNSIAKDVDTGEIIDPFNGIQDCKDRILNCVGDTQGRFKEDYLRILRAMRFIITKHFKPSNEIEESFHKWEFLNGLGLMSRERVYEELVRCFEYSTWLTIKFLDEHKNLKEYLFCEEERFGLSLKPYLKHLKK